jgi:hypothetical protein
MKPPVARYSDSSDFYPAGCGKYVVCDIAGVQHASRLEAKNLGFFIGAGPMLHPAWHHQTFAGPQADNTVSKFDAKLSLPNHEELIFVLVMVPRKLSFRLDDLDLLPVQIGNYLGPPMFVEQAKFLDQIDFGRHAGCSFSKFSCTSE